MAVIGVVTDDFTGTASAGMLMAKAHVETGLFFDDVQMKNFNELDQLEAVYVSTNSRHLPPRKAYQIVADTTKTLGGMGIKYFSKKIDTTLRGGIGYEIDAMLDYLGEDAIAVMVTAMPQSKRICVGGYSVIDSVILSETPVADDVKTPVKDCYVPDLIAAQSGRKVDWISIREVKKGKTYLMERLRESRGSGNGIIIIDAVSMEHVEAIAEACAALCWEKLLAVDPGPFTMKLAAVRGIADETAEREPEGEEVDCDRTTVMIVGSANPQTGLQIRTLCEYDTRNIQLRVDPKALAQGGETSAEEVNKAVSEFGLLMDRPAPPTCIIVETAFHGSLINLQEQDRKYGYENGVSSDLINQGLAAITDKILEKYSPKITGLMLTGGDTMECVARKIGVTCIKAVDNIVAQVDVGRILGRYEGMPIVVKGGFCGYDTIGIDIVKRLQKEAVK